MEYGNTGFYGFHGHGHSNDLGLPRRTELSEETLVGVAAADLRRWAGINSAYGGMDDDLKKAFLAARTRVAAMTGRAIAEAERIDYYGCWHSTLTLSGRPLDPAAVVVHYLDEGGDEQTVAAADYEVDATARRPAVRFGETPDHILHADSDNPVRAVYARGGEDDRSQVVVDQAAQMAFEILVGASPRRSTWRDVERLARSAMPRSRRIRSV